MTFETIVAYFEHKARTTFSETGLARQRELAHRWNEACSVAPGWQETVDVPILPDRVVLAWDAFPQGLLQDVEAYLATLSKHTGH